MKRCPTCQKTFDDSMKFCQIDGTPLVSSVETDEGGNSSTSPVNSDFIQTQIISNEDLKKDSSAGEFNSAGADDFSPPTPFGSSTPTWMDSPGQNSDNFSSNSSPFNKNASSGYRSPSTPFKEPEPMFDSSQDPFNQSPFGSQSNSYSSPGQQTEWTPPPAPVSEWQNQNLGVNTPFQPPVHGQGDDKTLAIVSLVCGILSLTCCGAVTGIAALITGNIAKNNVDSNPQQYGGRGLAVAGMIMGGISLVLTAIWLIFVVIGGVFR